MYIKHVNDPIAVSIKVRGKKGEKQKEGKKNVYVFDEVRLDI